jgi:SHS2 domain-containing protein
MMPKGYEFFDHTADIGAHIYGATLPELFSNAARAMYEVLGRLEKSEVYPPQAGAKSVQIEAQTLEDLLHDWLTELLYDFSTRQVLYDRLDISEVTPQRVVATVTGGVVDFARSELREEIKGVTYHQLRVEQIADGMWQADVIFDV